MEDHGRGGECGEVEASSRFRSLEFRILRCVVFFGAG